MKTIKNPIIPGFYPDPSICRVGNDYYLICSSFELFPGIPLFHSTDLVNWQQITNVMSAQNDFTVRANTMNGGVFAPTIRYYNGTFYIIDFCDGKNFIVSASNPEGPWSKPHFLNDVTGFDASLFIDDDGSAYIVGNGIKVGSDQHLGIYVCPFDLQSMSVTGEKVPIWDSALRGSHSPEAPHIYHIGKYYYLMIAEGGTQEFHAVSIARSTNLFEWFEGDPANPILTNRQLGRTAKITNIGHADLCQDSDGNWFAVCLGSRPYGGYHKNIGRETFLCPVVWENDWPICSPKTGKMEFEYNLPGEAKQNPQSKVDEWTFDGPKLPLNAVLWGSNSNSSNVFQLQNHHLTLSCQPASITKPLHQDLKGENPPIAFMGRRQTSINFTVTTKMNFVPQDKEAAGIAVMQASNHQFRFEVVRNQQNYWLRLILVQTDFNGPSYLPTYQAQTTEKLVAKVPIDLNILQNGLELRLQATGQNYRFMYCNEGNWQDICSNIDARLINPEKISCMVGTLLGVFATSNERPSTNHATFDNFTYTNND